MASCETVLKAREKATVSAAVRDGGLRSLKPSVMAVVRGRSAEVVDHSSRKACYDEL